MIEVELNDKQRRTLALDFRAEGLANAEIARRLGISPNAVQKILLHPALETKTFPHLHSVNNIRLSITYLSQNIYD